MTDKRGRPPHDDQLTPAEWRVVELVRHGMTNPRIAAQLGVSVDAVKYHVANALSKLGLDDKRALRQWDGVSKASALHGRENEMTALALGPIGQIARTVKDIKAAEAFYKDTLRLPHLFTFGNLSFFDCGGVRLFLSQGDGDDAASILYFAVPDIRAAHEELKARGVKFTDAPHMIHKHADGTEEWMNFFEDNESRPLAIMARVKP
ncbi:MAG TPA: LuxR C-terminal-related transcriptional regulator [Parvularculaceae bacterium]|nr:LuxR C-terminal-related transcriptional regulator [Parvularculaceae bacterium]